MDSSTDSAPPAISQESMNSGADSLYQLEDLDNALAKSTLLSNVHDIPAVADEHGALRVSVDPKYLPSPRAQQAPEVTQQVAEVTQPRRLKVLYEIEFQRLERELLAKYPHAPSYVTEGNVATLSLVSVSTGSTAIFESALEEHFTGPAK